MNSVQLDLWQDEVDALPWGGRSPRSLVRVTVDERIREFRGRSCVVDKSDVECGSREAQRFDVDPAQYQLCVSTSFSFL